MSYIKEHNKMAIRGIGVEGVASEIGALGRTDFTVNRTKLVGRLQRRFQASAEEAESAIQQAKDVNVVTEAGDQVSLVMEASQGHARGGTMKKVLCPVCWHEETFRAIRQNDKPVRDNVSTMLWHRPEGGARGQIVTMWDGGHWRCQTCGISLPPRMAGVLIDAVLRVSDPDSDSYDENEKVYADSVLAIEGGTEP